MPTLIRQINSLPDSIEVAREVSIEGGLLQRWGSRSLAWRVFLGLLPVDSANTDDGNAMRLAWVNTTRASRAKWAELERSMSLIVIAKQTKNFNPLAPPKAAEKDDKATQEKEMKDLIKQDVSRTLQEFDHFRKVETKDLLTQLLYLWGRENPDYGYKQGMNEILAIVLVVFDTERLAGPRGRDWNGMSDEQIASSHFLEYMLDGEASRADIYSCFDRILQLGIKHLYMDTKDISELKASRMRKAKDAERSSLFQSSVSKDKENK